MESSQLTPFTVAPMPWLFARPPRWFRYLFAVGVVVVSTVALIGLRALLALDLSPVALFLAAVMISAWYGGLGPGLLATLVSGLVHLYFFQPPIYRFMVATLDATLELIGFVLAALVISSLNARLRAARAHAEAAQRRLTMLAAAGQHLALPLETETLLTSIPRLVVPAVADGCAVGILTDQGVVRLVTSLHRDPATATLWRGWLDGPTGPALTTALQRTVRTGQVEVIPRQPASVPSTVDTNVVRAMLGAIEAATGLVVPLRTRQRPVGVLLCVADAERGCGPADVAMVEELAGRIAAAVDHTRVYREEQTARGRAEGLAAERAAILAQIADAVVIAGPDGGVTFINPAARRLLGLAPSAGASEADLALPPFATLDGRCLLATEAPLGLAGQRGVTIVDGRWRLRRPDQTEVMVQGSVAPVLADDGARLGAVLTLHDITAQQDLDRQKDEFFAHISHDLRTPITAIKASIGAVLANASFLSDTPRELLINADEAADRLTRLINSLLELSRLQAGRVRLRCTTLDLREVARRAVQLIEPLTQTRAQQVQLTLPAQPVPIVGDSERLERALVNLVTNAHQYGREGGRIQVTVSQLPEGARLTVADDGPGIALDDQERIFDQFYRGINASTASSSGSGLGLAITRAVVTLHGGQLGVDSRPGAGATFWVTLPSGDRAAPAGVGDDEDPDRR